MADLFDIVTARKLSGGGGGGSSDFSTAQVTMVNNFSESAFSPTVACAYSEEGYYISQGSTYIEPSSTASFTAILFKGQCELYCYDFSARTIALSGDIRDDGMGYYIITGDCTITIS